MELGDFKVLSFDCYGTLIDWETGILNALTPLTQKIAPAPTPDRILETFGRHEAAQEAETPTMIYSTVLAAVHARLGREWSVTTTAEEDRRFGASVGSWPAFEDSPDALRYLQQHFKLVILSNVDRDSFKRSNERLQVHFDWIFTAQDIGSYKPAPDNFDYLISRMAEAGHGKSDILHTAESLFHDHAPAKRAGLASAWIHRRHSQPGFGATAPTREMPHFNFRFTSLAEMAEAHRAETRLES